MLAPITRAWSPILAAHRSHLLDVGVSAASPRRHTGQLRGRRLPRARIRRGRADRLLPVAAHVVRSVVDDPASSVDLDHDLDLAPDGEQRPELRTAPPHPTLHPSQADRASGPFILRQRTSRAYVDVGRERTQRSRICCSEAFRRRGAAARISDGLGSPTCPAHGSSARSTSTVVEATVLVTRVRQWRRKPPRRLRNFVVTGPREAGAHREPERSSWYHPGVTSRDLRRWPSALVGSGRRLGGHRRRAGHVQPRGAGQGVRRRPRRAPWMVGVLQRHRRQSRQPGRRVDLGLRDQLRGPGHRVEPWGRGGVVLGHRPPDPAIRWAIATIPAEGWTPSTTAAPSSTPRSATGSPARRSPTCLLTHSNDWRNLATCRRAPRRPRRGSPSGATAGRGGMR